MRIGVAHAAPKSKSNTTSKEGGGGKDGGGAQFHRTISGAKKKKSSEDRGERGFDEVGGMRRGERKQELPELV